MSVREIIAWVIAGTAVVVLVGALAAVVKFLTGIFRWWGR